MLFPDFTRPEVRDWWSDLFKELIEEIGVKEVWNDMNEPAVMEVPNKTFPDDVRHDYDGNPCSRKAHNIYGMQMARATYQGLKRFAYPKRPFVITRALIKEHSVILQLGQEIMWLLGNIYGLPIYKPNMAMSDFLFPEVI